MSKKIKIDWKKLWQENSDWFDRRADASWESQERNIKKLVEAQIEKSNKEKAD